MANVPGASKMMAAFAGCVPSSHATSAEVIFGGGVGIGGPKKVIGYAPGAIHL